MGMREQYENLMNKKVSARKFLVLLVGSFFFIPLLLKSVLAGVWLRNDDGNLTRITRVSSGTFDNGDLSSGILTITHNWGLSAPYPVCVTIYDNSDEVVYVPQTGATNSVAIDLSSEETITGTWGYVVTG